VSEYLFSTQLILLYLDPCITNTENTYLWFCTIQRKHKETTRLPTNTTLSSQNIGDILCSHWFEKPCKWKFATTRSRLIYPNIL